MLIRMAAGGIPALPSNDKRETINGTRETYYQTGEVLFAEPTFCVFGVFLFSAAASPEPPVKKQYKSLLPATGRGRKRMPRRSFGVIRSDGHYPWFFFRRQIRVLWVACCKPMLPQMHKTVPYSARDSSLYLRMAKDLEITPGNTLSWRWRTLRSCKTLNLRNKMQDPEIIPDDILSEHPGPWYHKSGRLSTDGSHWFAL